jgi:hypothetical protein
VHLRCSSPAAPLIESSYYYYFFFVPTAFLLYFLVSLFSVFSFPLSGVYIRLSCPDVVQRDGGSVPTLPPPPHFTSPLYNTPELGEGRRQTSRRRSQASSFTGVIDSSFLEFFCVGVFPRIYLPLPSPPYLSKKKITQRAFFCFSLSYSTFFFFAASCRVVHDRSFFDPFTPLPPYVFPRFSYVAPQLSCTCAGGVRACVCVRFGVAHPHVRTFSYIYTPTR